MLLRSIFQPETPSSASDLDGLLWMHSNTTVSRGRWTDFDFSDLAAVPVLHDRGRVLSSTAKYRITINHINNRGQDRVPVFKVPGMVPSKVEPLQEP